MSERTKVQVNLTNLRNRTRVNVIDVYNAVMGTDVDTLPVGYARHMAEKLSHLLDFQNDEEVRRLRKMSYEAGYEDGYEEGHLDGTYEQPD